MHWEGEKPDTLASLGYDFGLVLTLCEVWYSVIYSRAAVVSFPNC